MPTNECSLRRSKGGEVSPTDALIFQSQCSLCSKSVHLEVQARSTEFSDFSRSPAYCSSCSGRRLEEGNSLGKLHGLLASPDQLQGILDAVSKKRTNNKSNKQTNLLFSMKGQLEDEEVDERAPFLGQVKTDESVREEMGIQRERDMRLGKQEEKRGSNGERPGSNGEKRVSHGEKRVSYGEKRGDRCLVINSHWTSAAKAAPIEQALLLSAENSPPSECRGARNESEREILGRRRSSSVSDQSPQ